jgi:hypothetical protein
VGEKTDYLALVLVVPVPLVSVGQPKEPLHLLLGQLHVEHLAEILHLEKQKMAVDFILNKLMLAHTKIFSIIVQGKNFKFEYEWKILNAWQFLVNNYVVRQPRLNTTRYDISAS